MENLNRMKVVLVEQNKMGKWVGRTTWERSFHRFQMAFQ